MLLLVLLLPYLYLPHGQSAEEEVLYGIGIKLCNLKCIHRGSCMRFAYNIERLACYLSHKDARYPKNKDQSLAGACSLVDCNSNTRCVERRCGGAVCVEVFSSESHTASSTLEARCITDSDCPTARNFVCFTRTCKCVPGYSFNPVNNNCVRHCLTYGNGFMTYDGMSFKGFNTRLGRANTTKECSEMCIREETYICRSFKRPLRSTLCQLSSWGYLDVLEPWRQNEEEGWVLGIRNCA